MDLNDSFECLNVLPEIAKERMINDNGLVEKQHMHNEIIIICLLS